MINTRGGSRGAHPAHTLLKLEKIWFFGVKSWFFTRNTSANFAPPSARRNFFMYTPLTCNPGSAPEYYPNIKIKNDIESPNNSIYICPCLLLLLGLSEFTSCKSAIMFKIIAFSIITLFTPLYVMVGILLTDANQWRLID